MPNYAYSETLGRFREDLELNTLYDKVESGYVRVAGKRPTISERQSWSASYPRLLGALAPLPDHTVISLEERMPIGGPRADVTLCGRDARGQPFFVVIELKAWSEAIDTGRDFSVPHLAGLHEHPASQAANYCEIMADYYGAFQEKEAPILQGCAFCFNLDTIANCDLVATAYQPLLTKTPLFDKRGVLQLREFLLARLNGGHGAIIRHRIDEGGLRPSRRLLDHANEVVRGQETFRLLGEQRQAQNTILDAIHTCSTRSRKKKVILVEGGPGTGKSVVALNAFARALPGLRDENLIALVSGSGAFTHTLRRLLPRERALLRFTDAFWNAGPDSYQLIIVDEAHRIRERSEPKVKRDERPKVSQLEELVRAARVLVLLMDENQIISPREVGHPETVRELVKRLQKKGVDIELKEFTLADQYRCRGSDQFVAWLTNGGRKVRRVAGRSKSAAPLMSALI